MPLRLKATKSNDPSLPSPSAAPPPSSSAKAQPVKPASGGGQKLKIRTQSHGSTATGPTTTSASSSASTAHPDKKLKLNLRKGSIAQTPRTLSLKVKGFVPPRPKGVGYDSEDDETEKDPAIEQQFVLRMQPGEDADYLRKAINDRKIGVPIREGGADVSLRFLGSNHRRAVVTVRGRTYAAVLVDLPCVVETHKSWDKRGWWKVTDISQMLLVLGRCINDDAARHYQLPREVEPKTLQYAHGLTPPMHWVRKRRFRKRMSYQAMEHVEEEVERMLQEDERAEQAAKRAGLSMEDAVKVEYMTRDEYDRRQERAARQSSEPEDGYDEDAEADEDIMDTVENDQEYNMMAEGEEEILEADLEAAMNAQMEDVEPAATEVAESPAPMVDRAGIFTAAQSMADAISPAGSTPAAETPGMGRSQTGQSSDEDESEDEDSIDDFNEDAAEMAAEKQQQLEEVADLERELKSAKEKYAAMKNQLLRNKQMKIVQGLEEDLRLKRRTFGLEVDDDE